MKNKTTKNDLRFAIMVTAVLMMILILFPISTVYAAENTAGSIKYDGSENYCQYDVKIGAYSIDNIIYSSNDFYVEMKGIKCDRNIFTHFTFSKTKFELIKGDEIVKVKEIDDFTIKRKGDVPKHSLSIFNSSDLDGTGEYLLAWSGKISTHLEVNYSGQYRFFIE